LKGTKAKADTTDGWS